jgi:hypothetical protein
MCWYIGELTFITPLIYLLSNLFIDMMTDAVLSGMGNW